jgi:hypothetical protein
MKGKTMLGDTFFPPALNWVLEEANRPRLPEEDEAGRRFVRGEITAGEYLTALHKARSRH